MTGSKPLLAVLKGEMRARPPVWLMRQAGRYLPEYRALRAEKGGFLALATDPQAAAEVTVQPIRRFGFDGAILFSDILMVPWALGQDLTFGVGEGPRLAPALVDADLAALTPDLSRLDPVYETVRQVAAMLPAETTFLGFAGSPWTVATYMVAGAGSKDQGATRLLAYRDPARFGAIIDRVVDLTVEYLSRQIEAGVEAVQLFDSWAGSLSPAQFEAHVIQPNRAIVDQLRARHPGVPIIGFPKGAGAKLVDYAAGVAPDAIGLDETVDPAWANAVLPAGMPVQGNLDPLLLEAGGDALDTGVRGIIDALAGRPHVFNLGHGIGQHTPIAHVERLLAVLRG
ncbi:uroporphyrinogen decarboxylase [uncultured Sphingomonas sp.]|uniref:uroporphyrinogen decarboxylase n=1 Tax=uncultured Sphingomonas sp. TaxID=158754 RepID=UPI0025F36692|nr:uroporphyrinogen decarboxylase [uncultured Sphingomonas sp.]